jgi:membrane protease YdiL (CAAX protease family)
MDISVLCFGVVAIVYIGATIYLANQDVLDREQPASTTSNPQQLAYQRRSTMLRWLLYGILMMSFVFGLLIIQLALFTSSPNAQNRSLDIQLPRVDTSAALVYFVIATLLSFIGLRVMTRDGMRHRIRRLVGSTTSYQADSSVHTVAIVLALVLLSTTLGQLVFSGGLGGLAQDVQDSGVSFSNLLFQTALFIAAAFLGVGLAIRRTPSQSLERLGLRWPTLQDVVWGAGIGVFLFIAQLVMVAIWLLLVPAEQFGQQSAAAEQITRSINTLPAAFLFSLLAAVSEEILFRGALQPVFGLGLTSLYFALIHIQYTLTPATLIIFIVALVLGWLRQRHSTSATVIAHFLYNFIQLAAAILSAGAINR